MALNEEESVFDGYVRYRTCSLHHLKRHKLATLPERQAQQAGAAMPADEALIRPIAPLSPEALALMEEDEEEDEEEMTPLQKARAILRNNYMVFVAADEDSSMSFGYHEFRGMLPGWLQRKYGDRVVRSWFYAMDRDDVQGRQSKVSLHEYFLFSVTSACLIAGCTIAALFTESDHDGSDELNVA